MLADPVVTAAAKKKKDGVLLIVTVGDRNMYVVFMPTNFTNVLVVGGRILLILLE